MTSITFSLAAASVGNPSKKNSKKRAPGALRLLGSIGGNRGAPDPTNRRAIAHHREAGLFADGKPYYKRLPKAGQPFQSWGSAGPVGVELTWKTCWKSINGRTIRCARSYASTKPRSR